MVIVANFCSETQAPQGAEIIILELALLFSLGTKIIQNCQKICSKKYFYFSEVIFLESVQNLLRVLASLRYDIIWGVYIDTQRGGVKNIWGRR